MRLTQRDIRVVLAVHEYRALRADQVCRLFFPSRNTANDRLKRLYQHRFLERRWLPVEYGHGMGQAIYLLGRRGTELITQQGTDPGIPSLQRGHNNVGSPFLLHRLMVNDVRIAFTQACRRHGYRLEEWVGEDDFKTSTDHVQIKAANGRRQRVAILPDAYCVIQAGDKRAHFFIEADRGTVPGRRWKQRVQAYLAYAQGGGYTRRFRTRSLRILTVTLGEKRLANLKRVTEKAGGGSLFWFTTHDHLQPEAVLSGQIWQVAGQPGASTLVRVELQSRELTSAIEARSAHS